MSSGALNIYHDTKLIGTLTRQGSFQYSFSYADSWLESPGRFRLSLSLPLDFPRHGGNKVRYFFGNLLPEGQVLNALAEKLGIDTADVYTFLAVIGRDCAGAISVLPTGETPDISQWSYQALSEEELAKRLTELPAASGYADLVGSARLSLAGAQDKLPVYDDGTHFHLPLNGAPSNCILKPDIAKFENSALNEHLCMELARACGLKVANTRLLMLSSHPCLAVERYDRLPGSPFPTRLHQEDFCQMQGLHHASKYEGGGKEGSKLATCLQALRQASTLALADQRELLRWYLFNLLIGNMDAHTKNISLLHKDGEWRLAPFYDLLSTTFYRGLKRTPAMSPLGMSLRLDDITRRIWRSCAARFGVKEAQADELLDTLRERMLAALPKVTAGISVDDKETLERLTSHLRAQISSVLTRE